MNDDEYAMLYDYLTIILPRYHNQTPEKIKALLRQGGYGELNKINIKAATNYAGRLLREGKNGNG